ncbi:MAG: DNA polymerase III subunit gamma/tau [Candidatus Pacebacteria bacterium]|nr:DNA polymerase III subunit gamma/tau [Candidatus Paceibacterota bacterium]
MKGESHSALYRKYRPSSFKDVLGQDHIIDVLQKEIETKNIAHAYLFAGGRGTGKTTVARILAKEIGTTSKDLYEMDAASNRKIDDFRELNESVHTLPFDSEYKVYIIDEVHMLTKEAFNAFLKTLEEPPKHVIFILATTEIDKLPDTIVSRCQSYTFKQPTRSILTSSVSKVAKGEKVVLEKDAAELIAILAEGSFRDALGILQKVLSYSSDLSADKAGKKITRSEVELVTGAPRGELVSGLLTAISEGNLDEALRHIQETVEAGVDFVTFQKLLLDRVRAVMLLRNSSSIQKSIEEQFGKDDFTLLKKLSTEAESKVNSKTLLALLRAYTDTPHAYIKQLPLELAVISILGN